MNELSRLKPPAGARQNRKRVGRGRGSGNGKTAGRGHNGQNARTGSKRSVGFEGGQMPLHRRVPKRGFRPLNRVEPDEVNLRDLNRFEEGETVTPERLLEKRLIRKSSNRVKILGNGELRVGLTVHAHAFSKSAREAIAARGGSVEVIGDE